MEELNMLLALLVGLVIGFACGRLVTNVGWASHADDFSNRYYAGHWYEVRRRM